MKPLLLTLCLVGSGCRPPPSPTPPTDAGPRPSALAELAADDGGQAANVATALAGEPRPIDVAPDIAAEPLVMGGLDIEDVRKAMRAHQRTVRACHEKHLERVAPVTGTLLLKFIIGASGAVATAQVAQSTLANPELEACVVEAARHWTFPPPKGGGVVIVKYPFRFEEK